MQPDDVSCELDLGEPPAELVEYAREELGESPDTRAAALQELRDMIFERGEVEPHRTDDLFLLRFLRARCFHVERAHKLLVSYYKFIEDNPYIQKGVSLMELDFIGEDDVLGVLPYREQTGRRIMYYRIGNWDPSRCTVEDLLKASLAVLELGILEQRAQILGGIAIFDLEGLSLSHTWYLTPSVAAKVMALMGMAFPMRIHAIHIINQSWLFDIVFSMFKPFLQEKMREKIHIHGCNLESLHAHIDPKFLPEKYGGTRPEYSYRQWMDTLSQNPLIVKELKSLGYTKADEEELETDSS